MLRRATELQDNLGACGNGSVHALVHIEERTNVRALVFLWLLMARAEAEAPPGSAAQRGGSGDEVVAKVQKYYDATRDLRAHFEQTLKTALGSKKKASGELTLK